MKVLVLEETNLERLDQLCHGRIFEVIAPFESPEVTSFNFKVLDLYLPTYSQVVVGQKTLQSPVPGHILSRTARVTI